MSKYYKYVVAVLATALITYALVTTLKPPSPGSKKRMLTTISFDSSCRSNCPHHTVKLWNQRPLVSWIDNNGAGWVTVDPPGTFETIDCSFWHDPADPSKCYPAITVYDSCMVDFDPVRTTAPPAWHANIYNQVGTGTPEPMPPLKTPTSSHPRIENVGSAHIVIPIGPNKEAMQTILGTMTDPTHFEFNCTYIPVNGGPPATIIITVTVN